MPERRAREKASAITSPDTSEFDFRYNNRAKLGITDTERAEAALKGAAGKRLMYRRIGGIEG
jgi:hypothetical protein